jgi:hypothetical protein
MIAVSVPLSGLLTILSNRQATKTKDTESSEEEVATALPRSHSSDQMQDDEEMHDVSEEDVGENQPSVSYLAEEVCPILNHTPPTLPPRKIKCPG